MGESNEPGWSVRQFLEPAQANGAAVLLTVPTAGYVAADKKGDGDVNQTELRMNDVTAPTSVLTAENRRS
jgi:hypothetical protein